MRLQRHGQVDYVKKEKKEKKTYACLRMDIRFDRYINSLAGRNPDGSFRFVFYSLQNDVELKTSARQRRDDPKGPYMKGHQSRLLTCFKNCCEKEGKKFDVEKKRLSKDSICMNSKCSFKCWAVKGLSETQRVVDYSKDETSRDHVRSLSEGHGKQAQGCVSNFQLLCTRCNNTKVSCLVFVFVLVQLTCFLLTERRPCARRLGVGMSR